MRHLFLSSLLFVLLLNAYTTTAQNPYESLGIETKVLTLTEGKYPEFIPNEKFMPIGGVLLNTETGEVVEFLDPDTVAYSFDPTTSTRFLSVDPIARAFPELTPYQFASNRPIDGIDLDGLEFKAKRRGNTVTIKAHFKVLNSADVLTSSQVKAYAEGLQQTFNDVFTKRLEGENIQFVGDFTFDIVDAVDRENDYFIEIIPFAPENENGEPKYSGVANAVGGTNAQVAAHKIDYELIEKTTGFEKACEDCIPVPVVEIEYLKKYELVNTWEFGLIGTHEVGHLPGLLHPWEYSGNGYTNVDIYSIYYQALRQLRASQTGTQEQNQVKKNIMNSSKNPTKEFRDNGTQITPGQLKQSVNNIKRKNEEENNGG